MKLLTSEAQEDAVKRRVEKKATVFGQSVTSDGPTETGVNNSSETNFKVDPSLVYKLYDQWVIPLTKQVEVEYLLHRLDWLNQMWIKLTYLYTIVMNCCWTTAYAIRNMQKVCRIIHFRTLSILYLFVTWIMIFHQKLTGHQILPKVWNSKSMDKRAYPVP